MTGARFEAPALEKAAEVSARYARERPGLGERFEHVLFKTADLAAAAPGAGRRVKGDPELRRWNLERFPYSFLYAEEPGGIVVVAIVHHKRRPGAWREDPDE